MHWEQKVEYAALSDIGFRRRNNQDAYVVQTAVDRERWNKRGHVFLVADGMGGHAVGELASKIAADTIPHMFHKLEDLDIEDALKSAVEAANTAIHERGELNHDFSRMGTTCTTLVLCETGALLGHVGDSRAYRIRGERIEQLTFDHSLQWELLKQGRMSPEEIFLNEPRNVITRSLGPEPEVQVDLEGPYQVRPKDTYILCSDGLSGMVRDEEIGIIARELPPADACQLLINLANLRGGSDNITVVIARVGDIPAGMPPAPREAAPQEAGFGWGYLASFFGLGVMFIIGNALMAMEKLWPGIMLEGLSILGVGGLLLYWVRTRGQGEQQASLPEITPGTPYRTASARLTREFVSDLAKLEYNLQRTALEEGWTIDWPEHNLIYEKAKTALAERRYSEALRDYSKVLHVLMEGVHLQRKQRDLVTRWGAKPPASTKPEKGPAQT